MFSVNFFIFRKKTPADTAKKRLKILVSRQKTNNSPNYLPQLQHDLIKVISKYIQTNSKTISIQFKEINKDTITLKLNITLREITKNKNTYNT